jgi:penicillin-binding protein 2
MLKRRIVSLVCLALITACNGFTPAASTDPLVPTAIPTLADACKVTETFLKEWVSNNYPAMYALLSPKSQQLSQTAFVSTYQDNEKTMANPAKSYKLDCADATQQGTTAIVLYDMTFKGALLGEFTDARRTIRLILTPRGWRVAWSTMDIFEGLAGGARLTLEYTTPPRGTIYDRNGKFLAKDNEVLYSAKLLTRVYPGAPETCFRVIADVFRRRYIDIQTAYGGTTGLDYGYWVGNLDEATYNARKTEVDRACTIQWANHTTRVYRGNGLAAQTIGYIGQIPADRVDRYVGYPRGALVGQDGLEFKYERQLAGTPGASLTIRASTGTLLRTISRQETKPAQDIRTTLDGDLQLATEQALSDAYNYAQPSWAQFSFGAAMIVMKVDTGEILAIASYPTFDVDIFNPNTYLPAAQLIPQIANPSTPERSPLRNRVTNEYSALASVMKIISMAAAADSGAFPLNQLYTCTGRWEGAKYGDVLPFRYDWIALDPGFKDKGNRHGPINLTQALISSCDAYFWEVGGALNQKDPNLLPSYALRMGLGRPTGITDLDELPGEIPSPDNIAKLSKTEGRQWSFADALNVVIGQGDVKVTPIQVAHMMTGVANGGTFYKPYLVASVGTDTLNTYRAGPEVQGKMQLEKPVIDAVKKGLCGVTQDSDLGTAAWFLNNWDFKKYMICGKTGTAQTGYQQPNGWFAAYVGPAGKPPEIVIVGLVERGREGSETAGPVVRRIAESYYGLQYMIYPRFWTEPYVPLADPNRVSDGGRH